MLRVQTLTLVSDFRGFQVSGGFKFQEVSEGFRRFQRVSNANVGFKFQVSEGFRWFQRVSNADAVSSFLVSGGKNKNVKDLKLFLTTNQTNLRIMV